MYIQNLGQCSNNTDDEDMMTITTTTTTAILRGTDASLNGLWLSLFSAN